MWFHYASVPALSTNKEIHIQSYQLSTFFSCLFFLFPDNDFIKSVGQRATAERCDSFQKDLYKGDLSAAEMQRTVGITLGWSE